MSRQWLKWLLAWLLICGLSLSASGQKSGLQSAGAKGGWAYYGLLLPAASAHPGERWDELALSIVQANAGSKKPTTGMQLKCDQVVTLRKTAPTADGNTITNWPAIVGVMAADSEVNVTEVVECQVSGGVQYWVKIQP